jgi:hypothetical protein
MRFVDSRLGQPPPQLCARAPREWQTRRELHGARRLADDHHAVARVASDDRERRGQIARIDALRARADARVKTLQRAFRVSDH